MNAIDKLISEFAGHPLCSSSPISDIYVSHKKGQWELLLEVLVVRNGFYAYESALHFFPLGEKCEGIDLVDWNRMKQWKNAYKKINFEGVVCFAENIFGDQFCLYKNGIGRMDAETGEFEPIANTLLEWADAILVDPDYHLGFSLAHSWQENNHPIRPAMRLMPKVPFVCGGEFDVSNLWEVDALKSLQLRGNIATQLHDLSDGSIVQFESLGKGS